MIQMSSEVALSIALYSASVLDFTIIDSLFLVQQDQVAIEIDKKSICGSFVSVITCLVYIIVGSEEEIRVSCEI